MGFREDATRGGRIGNVARRIECTEDEKFACFDEVAAEAISVDDVDVKAYVRLRRASGADVALLAT